MTRYYGTQKSGMFIPGLPLLILAFALTPVIAQQQAPGAQNAPPQRQIETLAVVNGEPVTRQQVATECLRRFGEEVLESIVNKQLVLDECKRRNVMITEQDVADEITKVAEKFGLSADRYVSMIATRRSISPDQLKNDHWHKLALRRLAAKDLTVTEEEIAQQMDFEFGPRVHVREIAVANANEAQQILAEARANPADFERLAKTHSLDTNTASMGGMLPPIRRNSGFPEFEQVAFALQPNQVSDVFQIEDNYIILKCERITPAMQLTPEQEVEIRDKLIDEISKNKLTEVAADLFIRLQEQVRIVNVMNDPKLSQEMPGVAAIIGESRITKHLVAEECIARFGRDMLEAEIMKTLMLQQLKQNSLSVEPEDLNQEIARVADEMGFLKQDGTPDVQKWLTFTTRGDASLEEFYLADEVWPSVAMRKLVEPSVSVSQQDMQMGFESMYGPRVEVLAILFSDQRKASTVWRMANDNPTQEYFGQLATQYSVEPMSQANAGVVPPIERHGKSPELEREAFKLKPGEISKVTQVGEHLAILYCKGMTKPRVTDFDAVKDELYRSLFDKKLKIAMAEHYYTVRESAQIDNFLSGTSQTGAETVRAARASGQNQTQRRKP